MSNFFRETFPISQDTYLFLKTTKWCSAPGGNLGKMPICRVSIFVLQPVQISNQIVANSQHTRKMSRRNSLTSIWRWTCIIGGAAAGGGTFPRDFCHINKGKYLAFSSFYLNLLLMPVRFMLHFDSWGAYSHLLFN